MSIKQARIRKTDKYIMIQKILPGLRNFYQQYPALYSTLELFLFSGLYFFYMWVSTFWFWGIYRFNIPVPDTIEGFFFSLWHMNLYLIVPSLIVGLSLLVVTFFVRKDQLKKMGIRLDNLKASGRECFIVFLIGASFIAVIFLIHLEDFTPHSLRHYYWLLSYPLWGTVQQFLLQSIIFIRLLQILKNKNGTIVASAVIFSFLTCTQDSLNADYLYWRSVLLCAILTA
jgi:hypothetical protein